MPKTLAQKAADKALQEAVERALVAYRTLPPGHQMVTFAVAVEGLHLEEDEEGDMPDSCGILFQNGTCRTMVARGLFGAAYDMMRTQVDMPIWNGEEPGGQEG